MLRATLMLSAALVGCTREPAVRGIDPCAVALIPFVGMDKDGAEVARAQSAARATRALPALERLGWLYAMRARQLHDDHWSLLAEKASECMLTIDPASPDAKLLQGHMLHTQHRFHAAEPIAWQLATTRGLAADHGLLGDVLIDLGDIAGAAAAYQRMVDLKPGIHSYTRVAHIRWLRGDIAGAIELSGMAVNAGSQRDPDTMVWVLTRLSLYLLQAHAIKEARSTIEQALTLRPRSVSALLAAARIHLAEEQPRDALASLRTAAAVDLSPDVAWALADVLHVVGEGEQAQAIEAQLEKSARSSDPRTVALFLATRGRQRDLALRLARQEMNTRADVFTCDALAWTLAASGRYEEAQALMDRALAQGTIDARLSLHAAIIAMERNNNDGATRWLMEANQLRQMLLPSEQQELSRRLRRINRVAHKESR